MNSVQAKFFVLVFSILLLSACGKEEPVQFSAQSVEVFAYDLVGSWEINASAIIKGVKQDKVGELYEYSFSYSVDLVQPDKTKLESFFNDKHTGTSNEIQTDIPIDIQFELDSTYQTGAYKLIINIKDTKSGNQTTVEKDFELSGE